MRSAIDQISGMSIWIWIWISSRQISQTS